MELISVYVSPLFIITVLLLLAMMLASVWKRKLTRWGGAVGIVTGLFVFLGGGYAGAVMLVSFFVLGVLATAHKKEVKARLQGAMQHQQGRDAWQVLANGGVAGLMGLLALIDPARAGIYQLMLAASLASATADTLSSELGMVYGRRTFNILTLKREPAGWNGVISLEGTLIGAIGALLIGLLHGAFHDFDRAVLYITLAGIGGNLADSVLGAALERKGMAGNDAVNLLNTLLAALLGWLLWIICPV